MDPGKVVEKITKEIILALRLPQVTSFPIIKRFVVYAYVAGWEEGVKKTSNRRPVLQLDQYGKVIKIHESATKAARTLDISASSITRVCLGFKNSYSGFHWKYVEDEKDINEILTGWQEKL